MVGLMISKIDQRIRPYCVEDQHLGVRSLVLIGPKLINGRSDVHL